MSSYAYAVIPYKNETLFKPEEGEVSCYPQLPEVKNIKSEFTLSLQKNATQSHKC